MTTTSAPLRVVDYAPVDSFASDVLSGLQQANKAIPCKYLYDERGSQLFEQICELEEYYPTRTETAIMRRHGREIARLLGTHVTLIEYGSGSSTKTRRLLDHLESPTAYVPIDISREHLVRSARRLMRRYPELDVRPICADFHQPLKIPKPRKPSRRRAVYYPGSTIGNSPPEEAVTFLQMAAEQCGRGGALVIGIDRKKDRAVLERAYNDAEGVTAEFNLNLLRRINRELGADFQRDRYEHRARFNEEEGCVEIHIVSMQEQHVSVGDVTIELADGEAIHTENSYKYDLDEFEQLARKAGWQGVHWWSDEDNLFSVGYLEVADQRDTS